MVHSTISHAIKQATKRIAVIGPTLAGLITTRRLIDLGHQVMLFDRNVDKPHPTRDEVPAILPSDFVKEMVKANLMAEDNLFDLTLPKGPIQRRRSYFTKDPKSRYGVKLLLQRNFLSLVPFNQNHLLSHLLKGIPGESYLGNHAVHKEMLITDSQCYINVSHSNAPSRGWEFDKVIIAEGEHSDIRRTFSPTTPVEYADYIAWQGIIDDPQIVHDELFNGDSPVFVFPNGYVTFYLIPAHDFDTSLKMVLTWTLYQSKNKSQIEALFPSCLSGYRSTSIPSFSIKDSDVLELHAFIQQVLPPKIATFLCQTSKLSIETVFAFQVPQFCLKNRVFLLGSTASLSGQPKALHAYDSLCSGMSLATGIDTQEKWAKSESALASERIKLSKNVGKFLINDSPNWPELDRETAALYLEETLNSKTPSFVVTKQSVDANKLSTPTKTFTPRCDFQSKQPDPEKELCEKIAYLKFFKPPIF